MAIRGGRSPQPQRYTRVSMLIHDAAMNFTCYKTVRVLSDRAGSGQDGRSLLILQASALDPPKSFCSVAVCCGCCSSDQKEEELRRPPQLLHPETKLAICVDCVSRRKLVIPS